ncbi:MAG: hypothetical protein ACOCRX_11670 [Candidatus Woesearchaeota archaeon]
MKLEEELANESSNSSFSNIILSFLNKPINALSQTREDYGLISEEIQERKRNARNYYRRKEWENREMAALLSLPVQFMSRLMENDFYGSDSLRSPYTSN